MERVRKRAGFGKVLAQGKMERAKLDLESERLNLIKEGHTLRNEEAAQGSDNSSNILNSLRLVP